MIHKTPLVTWGWIKNVMWRNDIFEGTIFVGGDWKIDMGKWDEHGMKFYVKGWLFKKGGTGNIPFWTSVETAFLDRNKNIESKIPKTQPKPCGVETPHHFFCHFKTMTSLAAVGDFILRLQSSKLCLWPGSTLQSYLGESTPLGDQSFSTSGPLWMRRLPSRKQETMKYHKIT